MFVVMGGASVVGYGILLGMEYWNEIIGMEYGNRIDGRG